MTLSIDAIVREQDRSLRQQLTVASVLEVTRPDGMGREDWAGIVAHAVDSRKVWADDPWSGGSAGWEEFCPPMAGDTPVTYVPRDTARDEYTKAVRDHFPVAGPNGVRGATLLAIAGYASPDGTNAYPANSTVASAVGCTRETVNRHARWAVANGWLRQTGTRGRAVVYRLTAPIPQVAELAMAA